MSETPEPAPLTEREMRQFVTLAALPTLERALERLRWLEAQRGGLTNPTTIMVRIDEGWITPSDAAAEIDRLRADLVAARGCLSVVEEIAERSGEINKSLTAEVAALKAHDPLAEMWRELSEYQPMADADGYGEAWRRMCEERTEDAAERAQEILEVWISAAALEPWLAAMSVRWAIEWGETSRRNVREAIAAIRRAKGGR